MLYGAVQDPALVVVDRVWVSSSVPVGVDVVCVQGDKCGSGK